MSVPPGWYPDPAKQAPFRWWDGNAWTAHTNGSDGRSTSAQPQQPAGPRPPSEHPQQPQQAQQAQQARPQTPTSQPERPRWEDVASASPTQQAPRPAPAAVQPQPAHTWDAQPMETWSAQPVTRPMDDRGGPGASSQLRDAGPEVSGRLGSPGGLGGLGGQPASYGRPDGWNPQGYDGTGYGEVGHRGFEDASDDFSDGFSGGPVGGRSGVRLGAHAHDGLPPVMAAPAGGRARTFAVAVLAVLSLVALFVGYNQFFKDDTVALTASELGFSTAIPAAWQDGGVEPTEFGSQQTWSLPASADPATAVKATFTVIRVDDPAVTPADAPEQVVPLLERWSTVLTSNGVEVIIDAQGQVRADSNGEYGYVKISDTNGSSGYAFVVVGSQAVFFGFASASDKAGELAAVKNFRIDSTVPSGTDGVAFPPSLDQFFRSYQPSMLPLASDAG